MSKHRTALLLAIGLAAVSSANAQTPSSSQEFNGIPSRSARAQPTGRLIVKWRKEANRSVSASARIQKASAITGFKLQQVHEGNGEFEVLATDNLSTDDLMQAAADLEREADVEYASVEYRRKPHALTTDPLLLNSGTC